jgi:IS5 family transposase
LSAKGDDLERIAGLVEFEMFRPELEEAVPRSNGTKGGRPAFDHVLMFKVLLLQAMHTLSDERCEYLIRDRLSFMRFLGLGLADAVPDANTIWNYREALKRAGAVDRLFQRFDAALREAGYLAMSGQIVDATIVAAPRQRNTAAEKEAIKAGRIPEGWAEKPAKLRQKDRDARWTVKFSKAKPRQDGVPQVDLAVPAFGYKSHISIDRRHGLIRRWTTSDAAAHDGARLAAVLDRQNTASDVWAEMAKVPAAKLLESHRRGTPPIARRRTRHYWLTTAWCRAFIARSPKAGRWRDALAGRTRASRRCVRLSSMSLPVRRGRWRWSCAPSGSPGRM